MENKFKLKNINIEFENDCENVIINFDNGEFIKIKDTEFETDFESHTDYWSDAHKVLNIKSDCDLKLYQIEPMNAMFIIPSHNHYSIFLDLNKLDSDIEISSGLLSILKEIDIERKRKKIEDDERHKRAVEALEKSREELRKAEEEQNRIWNLQADKNKEIFLGYINFLRKENLSKEIHIIYHYRFTAQLTDLNSKSFKFDFGGWNTQTSRALCREKVKNFIIDNAKMRGFDISFYPYGIRNQDFKEIIGIDLNVFFKNHFFEYNFKTSIVGEQHNQRWVVESMEIIEKTKRS